MSVLVSKVTSKGQITIPEQAREALGLEAGQRIAWEIQGDQIVGRRLPALSELYGALKSDQPAATDQEIREASQMAALSRHKRIAE